MDQTRTTHDELPTEGRGGRGSLAAVARFWWMPLVAAIAVAGVAIAIGSFQTKEYTATATLLFRDSQVDDQLFGGSTVQPSQSDQERQASTNVLLASLPRVADGTATRLPKLTSDRIEEAVKVAPNGQSNLVDVKATFADPDEAALVANTFADQFMRVRRKADQTVIVNAKRLVDNQLAVLGSSSADARQRERLADRSEQLRILAGLQTGDVELAQSAKRPSSPSSPNLPLNGILGFVIGAILGVAVALLASRFDRKLRDATDFEKISDQPILGSIPRDSSVRDRAGFEALRGEAREAYRLLRASLAFSEVGTERGVVLITSSRPGEGKSTTALYMARAFASAGTSTVLVEADMRRPTLRVANAASMSGVPDAQSSLGLSEVLSRQTPWRDAIWRADDNPAIIFSGALPPNPTDLLESQAADELLKELREAFDLVIVDTPPIDVVADAIPLLGLVDAVISVGRVGVTTDDAFAKHCRTLRSFDAKTIGVIVNEVPRATNRYNAYYTQT